MSWDVHLTNLRETLAGLFEEVAESRAVASDAGLPTQKIAFQPRADLTWHSILSEAEKRDKVQDVIRAAQRQFPDHPALERALAGRLATRRGPDLEWSDGAKDWASLEKITGEASTLLPVHFLETGLERARSVARIVLADGELGTGFLIAGNRLVTNHHVIETAEEAATAVAQFDYQTSAAGLDLRYTEVAFAPGRFFETSEADDWTVVELEGDPNAAWGAVPVEPVDDLKAVRFVNIVQHPGGGPKQLAMYHNTVAYADDARIQYLTDTLPGSSGAPVFDSDWRLVAIHHSGGHLREPGTKNLVFRNEGIAIHRLLEGCAAFR